MNYTKTTAYTATAKNATIISAYCNVMHDQTICKIKIDGENTVTELRIGKASEKRLSFLTNGKRIAYVANRSDICDYNDGRRYITDYTWAIRFLSDEQPKTENKTMSLLERQKAMILAANKGAKLQAPKLTPETESVPF